MSDSPQGAVGEEFNVGGGGDLIPFVFSLVKLETNKKFKYLSFKYQIEYFNYEIYRFLCIICL